MPSHGELTGWARQGVLLLNTVLTVRAGQPNSHKDKGWEIFTDRVISELNKKTTPAVFLLWGANAERKAQEELAAQRLSAHAEDEALGRLAAAVARATRLVNEDIMREAGYMLPQSANTRALLDALATQSLSADAPHEVARQLLERIPANEDAAAGGNGSADDAVPAGPTATYRCLMCGAVFEVPEGEEPVCPVCGARGDSLEKI